MTDVDIVDIKTPRMRIEKDRARYMGLLLRKDKDYHIFRLYGEKLDRDAAEIYDEIRMQFRCQICGRVFGLDEEYVELSFSFCDEYGCGMAMHKNIDTCLRNMGRL